MAGPKNQVVKEQSLLETTSGWKNGDLRLNCGVFSKKAVYYLVKYKPGRQNC